MMTIPFVVYLGGLIFQWYTPVTDKNQIQKTIIFEDDNVIAIFKRGESDFLFITFGDAISLANGMNIYADSVSTKLQYSSLGFMAKSKNWYPSSSMNEAIHKCRHIINNFSSIFLYGGSMGGYAAIKYSNKLKASHTLACCPQWSIDPNECMGNKSGYEKYFNQNLLGMEIKSTDMSGRIYVIYDPRHQVDSFHFSQIKRQSSNITGIHAQYIDHHVTTVISGSNNIHAMVTAIQSKDVDALKNIVRNIRKKSSIRRDNLLRRSSIKHPYLTAKVAINGGFTSDIATDALCLSINTMFENGDFYRLKTLHDQLKGKKLNINTQAITNALNTLKDKISDDFKDSEIIEWKCGNIITHHGSMLAYDLLSLKKMKQIKNNSPKPGVSVSTPVVLFTSGSDRILGIVYDGKIHPLVKRGSLIAIGSLDGGNEDKNHFIKYSPVDDECFTLSNNGLYLCAEINGGVILNRVHAKEWERFKAI